MQLSKSRRCRLSLVVRKGAPNKEHAVVRDDALGRFPQRGEAETSTGAGIGPGHKDASFVELAVPGGENIPDAGTDSGTHARMGIDARGKFEHGGTEKSDRKSTRLNSSHANISYAA